MSMSDRMETYSAKSYLRHTIGMFGIEAVHTALDELCKEEYNYLKKIYGKEAKAQQVQQEAQEPQQPQQAQQGQQAQEEEIPRPENQKIRSDTRVRIVKKPAQDEPSNTVPVVQAPVTQAPVTQVPVVQAPAPVVQAPAPVVQQHTESGLTDPKDIKRWQRDQEDKKKRELDVQGINPASLLTKENLHRWIVEEKKTFAAVAREYVGLPDSMVSSAAKSHGIQSETSKRRSMIAASKSKR
jgi:hypothetical protein